MGDLGEDIHVSSVRASVLLCKMGAAVLASRAEQARRTCKGSGDWRAGGVISLSSAPPRGASEICLLDHHSSAGSLIPHRTSPTVLESNDQDGPSPH